MVGALTMSAASQAAVVHAAGLRTVAVTGQQAADTDSGVAHDTFDAHFSGGGSSDDLQLRIDRGNLARLSGDLDSAIPNYTAAIDDKPHIARLRDLRGACYFQNSEFTKAVEDYFDALRLNPHEWWYWHERGLCILDARRAREVGRRPHQSHRVERH